MNRKFLGAIIAIVALSAIVGTTYALREDPSPQSPSATADTTTGEAATDNDDDSGHGRGRGGESDGHGQGRGRGGGDIDEGAAGSASQTQPVSATAVAITDFAFSPASITVKKGTTVTWTNNDSSEHTVTRTGNTGPDSQLFGKGETFSYTFTEAGTFNYFCEPHPSMKGTVVVTE